jgi:PhnB protein
MTHYRRWPGPGARAGDVTDAWLEFLGGRRESPPAFQEQKLMAITPYLTLSDANAGIEFYKRVFGATEKARMPAEDGKRILHAELEFAGQRLFLSDNMRGDPLPKGRPIAAVFVGYDKAADVDATAARAKKADAVIEQEPQDMFWGDRFAAFTDPFGQHWMLGAPKGS